MIHTVLNVLKSKLNEFFNIKTGDDGMLVKFIESGTSDRISFSTNAVTPFLINISEDRTFRQPDQYAGVWQNGIKTQLNPEVRIELLVLFVSNFSEYFQALSSISYVIRFFQANRAFDQHNAPGLSDENIERMTVELVSLQLAEQNQVWHSLHASYLPSVLYKVRVLTFLDNESIAFKSTQPVSNVILINEKPM
ncbi:DUF4255 domain-containing protein [[Flexibacter] sp. ATCC 35208]|uniref:DUF4255 domain-containing protein n=1 Tax=[Flexibacter] sp. ATCC 35208 TaxID=1936242 RepID=UPI0009CCC32F|nr:DUF4255 domain-containing protein [[Flexibacter] sp. ATCC 35208]OMP79647.1 hypothetical protein BW716_08730 [[Flexibacter] sp. ATCC 35208]